MTGLGSLRTLIGIATFSLIVAALPVARAGSSDEAPPYVDADGEEVFGTGYVPEPPSEPVVPLEIGRPLGGFQLGQAAVLPSNAQLKSSIDQIGMSKALAAKAAIEIPLVKRVRIANGLPKFLEKPAVGHPKIFFDAAAKAPMYAHFVNVGQGAGTILEFPCNVAVIDTGGEYASGPGTVVGGKLFAEYLARFFKDRPHLKNTIDVLFTSHAHEDHLAGLSYLVGPTGAPIYKVKNVVDNGQTHKKGSLKAQQLFRDRATKAGANYTYVEATSAISATGVSNSVIDPIPVCKGVDPVVTALWGSYNEKLAGGIDKAPEDWKNPNNHSLVLRVDFGRASFLFLGDLEDVGANEMLGEYEDNLGVFDVDVLHLSHHGAGDDTSDALVRVTSPEMAIISMGDRKAQVQHTAHAYGHPRLKAIDVLQKAPEVVSGTRTPQSFWVASATKTFKQIKIDKAIYGTGWEGTIVLKAAADGTYEVVSGET